MRVAFVGGGTGGHVAPGIGVAEALQADDEVLFLVAGRPVEEAMLAPRRLAFRPLFGDTGRPSPLRVDVWARASRRLRAALDEFDPDVVVLLGGWVSLPALWTSLGRRPSVLLEPNAVAGKVGRLLGLRSDHACLASAGSDMPRGRRSTTVTGVPGPSLGSHDRAAVAREFGLDPSRRTLVVTGGSQGAADLNRLVPAVADVLARSDPPWQLLHVTGPAAAGVDLSRDHAVPVRRVPFVAEMSRAWCLADAALCRAGSGTVAELLASGTPAVLLPYPHHADRHQEANARPLVEAGMAWLAPADDPTGVASVPSLVGRLVGELERAREAATRRRRQPDPAGAVAAIVRQAGAERGQ